MMSQRESAAVCPCSGNLGTQRLAGGRSSMKFVKSRMSLTCILILESASVSNQSGLPSTFSDLLRRTLSGGVGFEA